MFVNPVLYCDLNNTLLSEGGSLFHLSDGTPSFAGGEIIPFCDTVGIVVVLVGGQKLDEMAPIAKLLGVSSYIWEAGAGYCQHEEVFYLVGPDFTKEGKTPYQLIAETGAPDLLLKTYKGSLEYSPWSNGYQVSHLFRGRVNVYAANALLRAQGHQNLKLVDDGTVGWAPSLPGILSPRTYHLLPAGVSKANAIAQFSAKLKIPNERTYACGDSLFDCEMAKVVQRLFIVENGPAEDPEIADLAGEYGNVSFVRVNSLGVRDAAKYILNHSNMNK
ncbi:MAG TPA: HAD hydrolase family protein [Conexibacter sp.]|nr:HAD hydrolase family protein [Conexibacter sp.]